MSTYTAEDFANAKFAKHPDGRLAHRVEYGTVFAWSFERNGVDDYAADEYMAECGWVPVPTKPTITESQYRLALDEDRDPQYVYGFTAAMRLFGGEVIPDPEPTNKEKWVTFLRKVNPDSIMIDDYAEAIVAAGVTAPEDNA